MTSEGEDVGLIGIIGAAGQTGRALLGALARRKARVRAIGRNPDAFSRNVERAAADLSQPQSLTDALRGVMVAHYIPPVFNESEEQFGRNVIAAAEEAGCSRLVYHSVLHAATPDMPHHARKAMVELHLRHSTLEWTIIQPAMYAETALAFLSKDRRTLSTGFCLNKPFSPVALEDLVEAAACVLTQSGHAFATYELAGPERITFAQIATTLGNILGHPVEARRSSPSEVTDAVSAALGFGEDASTLLRLMLEHYDAHGLPGNANVLRLLLGREPTTVATALQRATRMIAPIQIQGE